VSWERTDGWTDRERGELRNERTDEQKDKEQKEDRHEEANRRISQFCERT
jgi:hypothetical protein